MLIWCVFTCLSILFISNRNQQANPSINQYQSTSWKVIKWSKIIDSNVKKSTAWKMAWNLEPKNHPFLKREIIFHPPPLLARWWFYFFRCSSLPEEMIQFDQYVSIGLVQPPTSWVPAVNFPEIFRLFSPTLFGFGCFFFCASTSNSWHDLMPVS